MIERLILFGASGDLTGRYLLPALAALRAAGRLPEGFEVVGAAQEDWDDGAFRREAAARLDEHAAGVPAAARSALVESLRYRPVDIADAASVARAVHDADSGGPAAPFGAYLALPPALFPAAVTALAEAGPPRGSRVALEKPFGEDFESAVDLNRLLARVAGAAGEHAAFRVDHFLGLVSVQNLIGMRLANPVLDAVWSSAHVERVEIVWEETLTLEGRAGYYDRAGQLKDMIQSHLMQVFCLIAMEPPARLAPRDLRDRKLDVMHAIRPLLPEELRARTRRARYSAGRVGERVVPAYADEDGVDPERCTETFAEVELTLDSERWTGTPFVLRTGKALGRERKEVSVRFRPAAEPPFGAGATLPSELRIGLGDDPEVELRLAGARAGPPLEAVPLDLAAPLPAAELPEYGRVLLEFLSGGATLSVRGDEAEAAWEVVTPILRGWADGRVPLEDYPAGSDGPPPRG